MAISDIQAPTPGVPGPACTVCATLASVPADEAKALRALLADPSWRYVELSDRLEDQGYSLPSQSLSRHARGRCLAREKLRGAR